MCLVIRCFFKKEIYFKSLITQQRDTFAPGFYGSQPAAETLRSLSK